MSLMLSCNPGMMSSVLSSGFLMSHTSNRWNMIYLPLRASANEMVLNSESGSAEYRSLAARKSHQTEGNISPLYGH
jgi:hypothetical protein